MERNFAAASTLFRRALAGKETARNPIDFGGYLPNDVGWRLMLAFSEQRNGDAASATASYREVQKQAQSALSGTQDNPYTGAAWHTALGWAQSGLGLHEASIQSVRQATELVPEATDPFEGPTQVSYLAQTYALNGDADHAIPLLEHLLQIPSGATPQFLRLDPSWDAIRDDPRFQNLVKDADHD